MERYQIKKKIEGKYRIISIIDTTDNSIVETAKVWRAPFSGGYSETRTELENLCKKLNRELGEMD